MKKIVILLITLMLLITLTGTVIADSGNGQNGSDLPDSPNMGGASDININEIGDTFRNAAQKKADELKKQVNAQINEQAEKIRARVKEQIERVKEQFEQSKERIKNAMEQYNEARNRFENKVQIYNEYKIKYNDSNEQVKNQMKIQIRDQTRYVLSDQADLLINKLEELIEKGIAPEETADLIVELETIKITLEDSNASKEEILGALKDIRDRITPLIRNQSQIKAAKVLDNKLSAILNKAEVSKERVLAIVEKLQAKGYDTTSIVQVMNEFEQKMSDANSQIAQAKALWMEAETAQEKHELLKEGFDIAKEANKSIIEGFHSLRQALKEIRELSPISGDDIDDNGDGDTNTPEDTNTLDDLNDPVNA